MQEHVLHIAEAASLPFVKKILFSKGCPDSKVRRMPIYIYTFLSSKYVYHEEHLKDLVKNFMHLILTSYDCEGID